MSGPLLDRIDLHVEVEAVSAADLVLPPPAEGSAEVALRVAAARAVQTGRYAGSGVRTNSEVNGERLETHATPDDPGRKLLAQAAEAMRLSARGYTRVLRVARTIADLSGSDAIVVRITSSRHASASISPMSSSHVAAVSSAGCLLRSISTLALPRRPRPAAWGESLRRERAARY